MFKRRKIVLGSDVEKFGVDRPYAWKKPAIAKIDQVVTDATWYEVLAETEDVRLIYIAATHDNDEDDNRSIQARAIIDGITVSSLSNSNADSTWGYFYLAPDADDLDYTTSHKPTGYYVDVRGQLIKIEMRMPSTWGTNETLRGRVQYEVWRPT